MAEEAPGAGRGRCGRGRREGTQVWAVLPEFRPPFARGLPYGPGQGQSSGALGQVTLDIYLQV